MSFATTFSLLLSLFVASSCDQPRMKVAMPALRAVAKDITAMSTLSERYRVPLDTRRDELRHPDQLIDFAKIVPGSRGLELGAGDGYTALHLATRVGTSGAVYAVNPSEWRGFLQPYLRKRFPEGRPSAVRWLERPFDDPLPLDTLPLDWVVNILTYHDLLSMKVDRQMMNLRIFRALADGGHYLIADHAALDARALSQAASLHRIGRQAVIDEVRAAGFRLIAESQHWRMPQDSRTTLAWSNPQPRTDRFILLFEK